MKVMPGIVAWGTYVPEKRVTNKELSQFVNTSDAWIRSHTGIEQRFFASSTEKTSDLATLALQNLLDNSSYRREDIDYLLVSTLTPDFVGTPSVANLVQANLQLRCIPSLDIQAACSGFVYALELASALVKAQQARHVAIVSSEIMSRSLDFQDRSTAILFGDGAAAALVTPLSGSEPRGILGSQNYSDGRGASYLFRSPRKSFKQAQQDCLNTPYTYGTPFLRMAGRETYLFAVEKITQILQEVQNTYPETPPHYVVCHQANKKIIEAASQRLGLPLKLFYFSIEQYANTSSASIPLSLAAMAKEGLLTKGTTVLTIGFGAGLTWGYNLIKF